MTTCENCGGPMVQLFTSRVCRDECDLRPTNRVPTWDDLKVGAKLLWKVPADYSVVWTVMEVTSDKVLCTADWEESNGRRYFHKDKQGDARFWQLSDHLLVP